MARRSNVLYEATPFNKPLFMPEEKEENSLTKETPKEPSARRKGVLHKVNKGNIGFFQGNRTSQNIFDGEDTSFLQQAKTSYTGGDYGIGNGVDYKEAISDAANASGGFGASFMGSAGDSLKFNGLSGLGSSLGSAVGGGISGIGSAIGGAIGGLIGNGYESGVGNVMNSVGKIASVIPGPWGAAISGGLQILGGGVNALFGTKVDQKKLQAANKGTAEYNNFKSNATSFDDIKLATAQEGVQDAYSGGAFRKGWAEEQNKRLHDQRIAARQFASNSVLNNVNNLVSDQINDALANFSAYGGPLTRKKKTRRMLTI